MSRDPSIGAAIGAGIALELSQESLLEQAQRFCSINLIFELTIPRLSLLAGRRLRSSLHRWFANLQIEDTPIPYACVSTNLNSAELAVHQSGDLRQWIAASMAVPGVFPPVVVDGFVHVDGGVLNNMPSDLIRNNGAGFIIGVDVAHPRSATRPKPAPSLSARKSPSAGRGHGPRKHPLVSSAFLLSATAATHTTRRDTRMWAVATPS